MNKTMIQEAVLNSVDQINEAQLFAEFDVLLSMANVYTKSALVQEADVNLFFDGVQLVQEADEGDNTEKESGRITKYGESLKEKGGIKKGIGTVIAWLGKALDTIVRAFRFVKDKLRKVFKRKKNTATKEDIQNWVEADCTVVLGETAQATFNLPAKPTVADFKKAYKAKDSANRKYNKGELTDGGTVSAKGVVSMEDIEVYFPLKYNLGGLVKSSQILDRACVNLQELYQKPDALGIEDRIKDDLRKVDLFVQKSQSGKMYKGADTLYSKVFEAMEQIEKYLNSAEGRIAEVRKNLKELIKIDVEDKYSGKSPDSHNKNTGWITRLQSATASCTASVSKMNKVLVDFGTSLDQLWGNYSKSDAFKAIGAKKLAKLDDDDREDQFMPKSFDD